MRLSRVGSGEIATVVDGEKVVYDELRSKWTCRGGELEADQLPELRQKMRALKKKAFKRTEVFILSSHSRVSSLCKGVVSSLADTKDWGGCPEYWVTAVMPCDPGMRLIDEPGGRSRHHKESASRLYSVSPGNKKLLLQMLKLEAREAELEKKRKELGLKLERAFPQEVEGVQQEERE